MPNYDFKKDIIIGHEAEDYVVEILKEAGYNNAYRVEGKQAKFDIIIPEVKKSIEVKNDVMASKTGNLAIELGKRNGEASGIMISEADIWIIFGDGEIYMFDREALKNYCLSSDHRITWGGDGNNAKMMLVPIKEIKTQKFYRKLG